MKVSLILVVLATVNSTQCRGEAAHPLGFAHLHVRAPQKRVRTSLPRDRHLAIFIRDTTRFVGLASKATGFEFYRKFSDRTPYAAVNVKSNASLLPILCKANYLKDHGVGIKLAVMGRMRFTSGGHRFEIGWDSGSGRVLIDDRNYGDLPEPVVRVIGRPMWKDSTSR